MHNTMPEVRLLWKDEECPRSGGGVGGSDGAWRALLTPVVANIKLPPVFRRRDSR